MTPLQQDVARKSASLAPLARRVVRQPELLPEVFAGLAAQSARTKYGCLRLLRLLSETRPEFLYPEINRFIELLDDKNQILQWGAIIMLGNLAAVDVDGRIEGKLGRYLRPISGPVMITAANVIRGAGKIARAKPPLADRIARALLRVEAAHYQTTECRNVAVGHAIESLESFFALVRRPQPVVDFVWRQLDNPRSAVKRKAAKFLKQHSSEPKRAGRPGKKTADPS